MTWYTSVIVYSKPHSVHFARKHYVLHQEFALRGMKYIAILTVLTTVIELACIGNLVLSAGRRLLRSGTSERFLGLPEVPVPESNPLTQEKIELGRLPRFSRSAFQKMRPSAVPCVMTRRRASAMARH